MLTADEKREIAEEQKRYPDQRAACVEGDVADEQHPVRGHGHGRAAVHDERSREAAEDLVGNGAVVVGVVPVGARGVVGGHPDEVVERGGGVDAQERVVEALAAVV